jgi:hypothetical protein
VVQWRLVLVLIEVENACDFKAKFLEQVFEPMAIGWQNMIYLIYPYFHGQKCRWRKLYQLQDADPIFPIVVPARLLFPTPQQ